MKLLNLFLALSICYELNAQFSFGLKAGVSQNMAYEKPEMPYGYPDGFNPGFHLGLYFDFPVAPRLTITPELQYIKKGFSEDYLKYNYLELPLLLGFAISKKIRLQAGPAIGGEVSLWQDKYLSIGYRDWDIDASIIAGIKYYVSGNLAILTRYNHSLLPIVEGDYFTSNTTYYHYKIVLTNIQLGVQYRLKGKTV